MPICKNSPTTASNKTAADISADHVTEAAQVKRQREQAYFNSYDFDAIEVLPYDEDDEEPAGSNGNAKVNRGKHQVAPSSLCDSASSSAREEDDRCSSRSSSGRSYLQHRIVAGNQKFSYLHRLGAFFTGSHSQHHHPRQQQLSERALPPVPTPVATPVGAALAATPTMEQRTDNFLLPRAMLKYQSVGQSATSMPSSGLNSNSNNNNNNSGSGSGSGSGQLPVMSNASKSHDCPNGHDSQTGFSNEIKPGAILAAASANVAATAAAVAIPSAVTAAAGATAKMVPPPRNKKRSIASTSSSTHTITDSGLGNERATAAPTAAANAHVARLSSSHQSHYSTEKSGSSGYYSSNVCSTYSLDEHIYCEPVIDILDASEKSKSVLGSKVRPQLQLPTKATTSATAAAAAAATTTAATTISQRVDMCSHGSQLEAAADAEADDDDADANADGTNHNKSRGKLEQQSQPRYSDKLRILENSIENLDRHLKSFPCLYAQEQITDFVQSTAAPTAAQSLSIGEKLRSYNQLPTIMEGFATQQKQQQQRRHSWQEDMVDDSLLDIDLDAFLLANERRASKRRSSKRSTKGGLDNPSFLTDEQVEENNYKCAKYINSCPDDAYRVESDIGAKDADVERMNVPEEQPYGKRYEDQLHFQNTRELLEDVRDKIRLLSRSRTDLHDERSSGSSSSGSEIPKELECMIQTLKQELESYLQRMNQHSELEIRQLCSGLGKNQHVVKIQNAFERRRNSFNLGTLTTMHVNSYESVHDGVAMSTNGGPVSLREQITTIRCSSDNNFKMKRKSITEVFPAAECYIESEPTSRSVSRNATPTTHLSVPPTVALTQMQRNLSFHKPVLSHEREDRSKQERDSASEWHRKKPSIWEMYYGTNRLHQSLLGKQRNGELVISSTQPTLSYPSSRPESDFTLDLPRAEQLRLKMEKEKKFRQRCRFITTFLSLVFFLLTVMVVSLVLTRGKRMFGSMI
ncbi:homeobox protein prospero [Scaptodrosophila lebanonensis]|uniref:Homeobox protein prospero n=1 Tax=Drosophila lebanonensis TaxID=7225 RepID=A0A6J2T183_DROLE|nr:homeobox protein prospero [Scaptodrosophila lebanonensis]XP_030369015.1 homeobox protein prospero [Scaptodrosophila lebanonensis]